MPYSARIIKGGALLDDTRLLIELWDETRSAEDNRVRIVDGNLLAKRSRARLEDVLAVLRSRFVDPGPQVIAALRALTPHPAALREACAYEAARVDELLALFTGEILYRWHDAGRSLVRAGEVSDWLQCLGDERSAPRWGEQVRTRIAHGLLSAARDFGVLEGRAAKRIATPTLSPAGFAYAAFREHEQGRSSRALIDSSVWHRWLLDRGRVEELFAEVDRLGVLRFNRIGSAIRIDWRVPSLIEAVRAAA